MIEYVPWALVGILCLLVLSLLPRRFSKRKIFRHTSEAQPRQGYAKTPLDFAVNSHSRTSENTADDLGNHSSDLNF